MPVALRPACPDDADALAPLYEAFFQEDGIPAVPADISTNLRRMLAYANARLWVAEEDGTLIGFTSATSSVGVEFGIAVEVEDLYVIPSKRGQGLARRLIAEPLAWAEAQGAAEVFLVVTPEAQADQDLIAFYERFGFTPRDRLILSREGG